MGLEERAAPIEVEQVAFAKPRLIAVTDQFDPARRADLDHAQPIDGAALSDARRQRLAPEFHEILFGRQGFIEHQATQVVEKLADRPVLRFHCRGSLLHSYHVAVQHTSRSRS
jgi:hypothetical protein